MKNMWKKQAEIKQIDEINLKLLERTPFTRKIKIHSAKHTETTNKNTSIHHISTSDPGGRPASVEFPIKLLFR